MTSYNLQPAPQDKPLQREVQSRAERHSSCVEERDHHPRETNNDSVTSVKEGRSISNITHYPDQYTPVFLPAEVELEKAYLANRKLRDMSLVAMEHLGILQEELEEDEGEKNLPLPPPRPPNHLARSPSPSVCERETYTTRVTGPGRPTAPGQAHPISHPSAGTRHAPLPTHLTGQGQEPQKKALEEGHHSMPRTGHPPNPR
ncbi:hypothetical protein CRENBAI_006341 [Crenichthys baileyi]|uniref:Uncharacterized protein n=1 Tax=Crenichthys baileyi TaxID=28760 RepID=A0AAV9QQC3_9TELE